MDKAEVVFIVDTDSYSGQFEREMCAYITGQTDDYPPALKLAKIFDEEEEQDVFEWFADNLVYKGCVNKGIVYRYTALIEPTPGFFNHGMGTHFPDNHPMELVLEDYNFQIRELFGNYPESIMDELKSIDQIKKYPAYMSVAIYLTQIPPLDIWRLMVRRAQAFVVDKRIKKYRCQNVYSKPSKILAIRLIKRCGVNFKILQVEQF